MKAECGADRSWKNVVLRSSRDSNSSGFVTRYECYAYRRPLNRRFRQMSMLSDENGSFRFFSSNFIQGNRTLIGMIAGAEVSNASSIWELVINYLLKSEHSIETKTDIELFSFFSCCRSQAFRLRFYAKLHAGLT